ncbi:MAG: LysM peptidoglycan-binding domain-containing protein [Treponema sp.]|nr:LysM peptidoglycan-binding domain-containing protein [Treponema sp.]
MSSLESEIEAEMPPSRPRIDRPLRQNRYAPASRFISPRAADHTLTIPGIDNPLTQKYIGQYSSPGGLAWLNTAMERSAPYIGFIREEIAARGLPPELVYLPVIESAYVPTAVSRSGAAGLWQFMRNSIAPFDIRVTDWMDERRDFWKSTVGALSKLEENYRFFGDWPLALAAYNAGLGAVRRTIAGAGTGDYWALSERKLFKNETIQYVPRFLAVAYILSNPRRFGITSVWPEDPRWTRIPVGRAVDLELLAEYAGIDGDDLKRANRELFYSVTPPDPGYHLKVRASDAPAVEAALKRTDLVFIKYYFHTVRSGDTLSAIGRHYGVSADQIVSSNPGAQPRYLKIGTRLIIPALKEVGPYQPPVRNADLSFTGNHLVKRGESLWSISLAYNVNPEALAEANGMALNDTLREGRSLKIPIRN